MTRMQRSIQASLFTLMLAVLCAVFDATAENWRKVNGHHFVVFYTAKRGFAETVLEKAEDYYKQIALDLGYPRYSEFWLWDERVKIYLYPSHASFLQATGQPQWSEGMADYLEKTIASYQGSPHFLISVLPHEIGHLIFRDFVGFKGEVPLWLDEGVAQWAEKRKRREYKAIAKRLFEESELLGLNDLMKLDIRRLRTTTDVIYVRPAFTRDGEPATIILDGETLVHTYYLQGVSLVGFLIERYGSNQFAHFCRQLRDGKQLNEALRFVYSTKIRDMDELEERWREYLEEELQKGVADERATLSSYMQERKHVK
jgi:hypothetical protein